MEAVDHALARSAGRRPGGAALLLLDIDRFKLVNDSLGTAIGDRLLVALTDRLRQVLQPGELIARIGGDELALLIESTDPARDALALAGRVQTLLGAPFRLGAHTLFASISIGVACSWHAGSADELLRQAEIAMYEAKRRGRDRDRCSVFDESMRRRVIERLVRENELRHAVDNGLLAVHYQPIVDLRDGRIRALEALARWPEGWGHVPPVEFIQIAEETGMINALGAHVMDRALADLSAWRREGLLDDTVYVSVNVSSRQIEDPRFPDAVRAAARTHGIPTHALRLEITESMLLDDLESTRRIVSELCIDGTGLHLDDFGTGYSSLATLNQLPFDALKIDRSFVGWLATGNPSHEILVRSAVGLAHNLGMRVIVEGIETPEQLRRLKALGCTYGQGYLFSRPLSPEGVRALLASCAPEASLPLDVSAEPDLV
jgi:diguanylate cyclase (GGDEF)-like protein